MQSHIVIEKYEKDIFDMYMRMHPNAPKDRVQELISELSDKTIIDIACNLHNNVSHETVETTMLATYDWIVQRNPIITGNGTYFKQHSEYLSPSITMLEFVQKHRSKLKTRMYTYEKGTSGYINDNNGQINVKVVMNADYGGSGTTASPFFSVYIPSATTSTAKNITTTLICCLEFLCGNNDKWAKANSINELYDMINIVLTTPDEDREFIDDDTFTPEEVCQWLCSRCSNITMDDQLYLLKFLHTLDVKDLRKLMLANNLRLVLRLYLHENIARVMSYLKRHKIDIENITEDTLHDCGFGVHTPNEIINDVNIINRIVIDNCVYPFILNDVEVRAKNMKRIIVCVTDTDSLMVHFSHLRKEFQSDDDPAFRDSCLLASAMGMRLFVEAIIPKMVSDIAISMNVEDKHYRDKLSFKNEFGFLAMALLAKKMYASSMFFQEGKPRDVHEIAITGLSFKKRDAAAFLEPIMLNLYDKYILTNKEISVSSLYEQYMFIRQKIIDELRYSVEYFKVLTYNNPAAYDANRVLPDQIRGSIVWNNLMPDEEIIESDRVKVIPLSFDLLEQNSNVEHASEILRLSLIENENKKHNPVICIPDHYKEMPNWLSPLIDVEFTTDKLLSPFKQLFGLFDFYLADTRGGTITSNMIYL